MLNPFTPNPFQMPGAGSMFDTSDYPTDYWAPSRPIRDAPTWENSVPAYPGHFLPYTPLANAPIIDESRFWREPTWMDRAQQGWDSFFQNTLPTAAGNLQDWRGDILRSLPGFFPTPWGY